MNNIVWSNKIDKILCKGMSLESIGVKNWSLSRPEALNALNQFLILEVPILGGDVCEIINGVLQYNYDNWYCDKLPNESNLDFVKRSIEKAREYIETYLIKRPNKIFFALVPGV